MTQLQEAIRDKITKYSDACGMCTDTIKECDTCGITCVLEDLNELQKLANNPDAVRTTAHWISVKDRLPKVKEDVLIYDSHHRNIYKAWYIGDIDVWFSNEYLPQFINITHWMPLPKPPEATHD